MIFTKSKFLVRSLMACGVIIFIYIWTQLHIGIILLELKHLEFNYTPPNNTKTDNFKYILLWTFTKSPLFVYMDQGQKIFIERQCPVQNCYITADSLFFNDITKFDAVLFYGPELHIRDKIIFPSKRAKDQKYVFVSGESSHSYPICKDVFNGFFNWTWTYRLDSDAHFDYITIRTRDGNIVGPNKTMHWLTIEEMKPIDENLRAKLQGKRKAAAWIASNCETESKREKIVSELHEELNKYQLSLDVFGACGTLKCPISEMKDCLRMVERDYYFYLSFENSFSEDLVTEKLLHALQHYAVPVVYGDANYTRFMPDGIYLDVKKLGVKAIAKEMKDLIEDKEKYYSFFKWHNHYSFHDPDDGFDSDSYCQFCAMMNNEELMSQKKVYNNFKEWWAGNKCFGGISK